MFERYSEKARRTIFYARHEASHFGSPIIETEHLLIGLLREDKALSNRLLPLLDAATQIREAIERHTVVREKVSTSVDLPLSNEAKRVLAYASEESERLGHRIIGCEHLLLGILREERCFAAQLLNQHGLTLAKAREDLQKYGAPPVHDPPPRIHRQAIPFGMPVPSIQVSDLTASVDFYKKLGFRDVYGHHTDPFRLLTGAAGFLAIYTSSLGQNLTCFTGGDLSPVLAHVNAGDLLLEHPPATTPEPNYLLLRDPDGHPILLISPDLRTLPI